MAKTMTIKDLLNHLMGSNNIDVIASEALDTKVPTAGLELHKILEAITPFVDKRVVEVEGDGGCCIRITIHSLDHAPKGEN